MNDTTRSASSHQSASCPAGLRRLPGTTEPYLLELDLQVARSYSSYCCAYCMQSYYQPKSMDRTLPFLVGSQEFPSSRAAQQSPSEPTRGGGKGKGETRVSQEGALPMPTPRHAMSSLRTLAQPAYKAAKQQQRQGEGGGLTG